MTEILRLKKSNCKNCYKCIRNCPVKSIRFSGSQAHIVGDECVLCGRCFVVCPQNAKEVADDTEKAKVLLNGSVPVFASIAPSFVANYDNATIAALEAALKKLGFAGAEETAIGATIVKKKYEELIKKGEQEVIISSCCHTVNLLIRKYFPEALPYLARVMSPMQAHALDLKRRHPGAQVIFIGPCISKKDEAESYPGSVDCVLTFEELTKWFGEKNIDIEKMEDSNEESRARFFPTSGGILKTMDKSPSDGYQYLVVDGMENCINALKDLSAGKLKKCFIEMSSCSGSCVNGPVMDKNHKNPVLDYLAVADYAGSKDFPCDLPSPELILKDHPLIPLEAKTPDEETVKEILRQTGKTRPEDELNCGSCGYNTCREKAIAVFQGKAELTMCLPFLKERAETFSNNILSNTPNGVIVLNERLEVQQVNAAAMSLMNIKRAADVLGEQVMRILDPSDFMQVLQTGETIRDKRIYMAEYKKYVEQTILYDKVYHTLMCFMRDVTAEETERNSKERISRQTIEITDKVVEKQMRVVQEIASLLGETTAETKIALTKLKETLSHE